MKKISQIIFCFSLAVSSSTLPVWPLCTTGLLVSVGALLAGAALLWGDSILERHWNDLTLQLSVTRIGTVVLMFIPIAMRASPGTSLNALLDVVTYASVVVWLSFFIAARLTPLCFLGKFTIGERVLTVAAVSSLVGYIVIVGLQLTAKMNAFSVEWVDFSFEFPPLWNTARGNWFRMISITSQECSVLRYHYPLLYAVLSPFSLLWESPYMVLWLQTVFIAATAVAAGYLAKVITGSRKTALWVMAVVPWYLPLHLANLFDFHADPLAMPLILLSFVFAVKKQWRWFALSSFGALLCKEYVGLVYAGFGGYLFLKKDRIPGAVTAVVGAGWLLFVVKVGIPAFNDGSFPEVIEANYAFLGGNRGIDGMILYVAAHPFDPLKAFFTGRNMVGLLSLFLPLLFIPFKQPLLLLAGILIVAKNGFSAYGINLMNHRETLFVPFILCAFITGVHNVRRKKLVAGAITIAVSVTFISQGHAFPARGFWLRRDVYTVSERDRRCHVLIDSLPRTASVMASSRFTPHLMNRKWCFLFPRFHESIVPDYVFVDTLEQIEWEWQSRKEQIDGVVALENDERFQRMFSEDGVLLYVRKKCVTSSE